MSTVRLAQALAALAIAAGALVGPIPLPLLEARNGGSGSSSGCCSTFCPTNPSALCTCSEGEIAECRHAPCFMPPYELPWQINCVGQH